MGKLIKSSLWILSLLYPYLSAAELRKTQNVLSSTFSKYHYM